MAIMTNDGPQLAYGSLASQLTHFSALREGVGESVYEVKACCTPLDGVKLSLIKDSQGVIGSVIVLLLVECGRGMRQISARI